MSFVLQGEINIDGRKGTVALKSIQREATRTSETFDRAGTSASKLARTFLSINSGASLTTKSLQLIAGTGGIGIFGAGLVRGGIALGDTLTAIGQEAETTGKGLDKAFRTGLKASTAEQVQSSIDAITSEIDRLRAKTEGFDLRRTLGLAIKGFTGKDFGLLPEEGLMGAAETQIKALQARQAQLKAIEEITKTKSREIQRTEENLSLLAAEEKLASLKGNAQESNLRILQTARDEQKRLFELEQKSFEQLQATANKNSDSETIEKSRLELQKRRITYLQAEFSLQSEIKKRTQEQQMQGLSRGEQLLMATRAGRQELANAEKRRQRFVAREDFRMAESLLPTAQSRRFLAEEVIAAKRPTIGEAAMATKTGIPQELMSVSELERMRGLQQFPQRQPAVESRNLNERLINAIEALSRKLPAAVPI